MSPFLSGVLGVAVALSMPAMTLAEKSCPPASAADPLPGATSVTFYEEGVTTARFPGRWQEGQFGEGKLDYRLFVDGSGTVSNDLRLRGWRVDFTCDLNTKKCAYRSVSSPPEAAEETAKAIAACLTAVPPKPPAPKVNAAATAADKPKAASSPPKTKTKPVAKPADPAKAAAPATTARTDGKLAAAPPPASGGATVTAGKTGVQGTAAMKPAKGAKAGAANPVAQKNTAEPPDDVSTSDIRVVPAPRSQQAAPAPAVQVPTSSTLTVPVPRLPAEDATPLVNCVQLPPSSKPTTRPATSPNQASSARDRSIFECDIPQTPALKIGARDGSVVSTQVACWADHLPDEPATARIQRMLLLAGFDAGPVDGKHGKRTKTALVAALGPAADGPHDDIIRQLRVLICK